MGWPSSLQLHRRSLAGAFSWLQCSDAGHTFYDCVFSFSSSIKILFTTCQLAYYEVPRCSYLSGVPAISSGRHCFLIYYALYVLNRLSWVSENAQQAEEKVFACNIPNFSGSVGGTHLPHLFSFHPSPQTNWAVPCNSCSPSFSHFSSNSLPMLICLPLQWANLRVNPLLLFTSGADLYLPPLPFLV